MEIEVGKTWIGDTKKMAESNSMLPQHISRSDDANRVMASRGAGMGGYFAEPDSASLYLHSGSSDAFGQTRAAPEGEIPRRIIGVGDRITDLGCTIDRLAQRLHDAGVMSVAPIPGEKEEKQFEDLTPMGAEIRKQSIELSRLNDRLNNLLLSLEL